MLSHFWENELGPDDYEVDVSRGFTELRPSAYTANAKEAVLDYRQPPADKTKIAQYLFSGFERSLYRIAKFQSDTERKLAIILERNASRWFRPAKGQFQIFYKVGHDQQEYQPDFVAETDTVILMLETKKASEMDDAVVRAKRDAALAWCGHASAYAGKHGGKSWRYVLIPHDAVAENMTLDGLVNLYG
jgi:type III restriction enzyme